MHTNSNHFISMFLDMNTRTFSSRYLYDLDHTEAQCGSLSSQTSFYLIWINWVESLVFFPSQYNFFSIFSREDNFVVMVFYFCGLIWVAVTLESVTTANILSFRVINILRSHTPIYLSFRVNFKCFIFCEVLWCFPPEVTFSTSLSHRKYIPLVLLLPSCYHLLSSINLFVYFTFEFFLSAYTNPCFDVKA